MMAMMEWAEQELKLVGYDITLGRTAATVWCLKERMVKHTGSRAECSGSGLRILRSMMENHSRVTIQVVKAE